MSIGIGSYWGKWDLHIHTKSSFDYDKNDYTDEGLVATWKEKGYVAVAITDHFLIDGERISKLQSLALKEGITVFPGVEFRTDKGDKNVHIIAIFSEKIDVEELASAFEYNMIKTKAKNPDSHKTIYWNLEDIQEFTKRYQGVLTVHAGKKSNGIDKSMSNEEFFMAIKREYAEIVDAFEVNNLHSYREYEKIVLPHLKKEFDKDFPVIICSDNHNYDNYKTSAPLWIKADPSFEGLKQALLHPSERIYLGDKPKKLLDLEKKPETIMNNLEIRKSEYAKNEETWFDCEIPLNPGLIALIGNKGSGKSALSDILGHANNVSDKQKFSFLNQRRFNKSPQKYGEDYSLRLEWHDGEIVEHSKLTVSNEKDYYTQTAQYLPQQYIEEVCTNLDQTHFQKEIDKVIFSYLSPQDSLGASDLNSYMRMKTEQIEIELTPLYEKLDKINKDIIQLESKLKTSYQKQIKVKLQEKNEELIRHRNLKPGEVIKPEDSDHTEELGKIERYKEYVEKIKNEISTEKERLLEINQQEQKVINLKSKTLITLRAIEEINEEFQSIIENIDQKDLDFKINLVGEKSVFDDLLTRIGNKRGEIEKILEQKETRLKEIEQLKSEALKLIDDANKEYQEYLNQLKQWEDKEKNIIGDEETVGTLEYYQAEDTYLREKLSAEYADLCEERKSVIKDVYNKKIDRRRIFQDVYSTIAQKIEEVLGNTNKNIQFKADLLLDRDQIKSSLDYINKRARSDFQGAEESEKVLATRIQELNVESFYEIENFIKNTLSCGLENDYDQLEKVINDKESYYRAITSLEYLEVNYLLTYNENTIEQLSPGERGLLLLIFYLLLNKESKPIIIDQPEDNLDNQSVYSQLVPCMLEAKKNRQVIVVTHNPNIAIACDAEQVIISEIDKASKKITYTSGGIESDEINAKIVEILEGTRPAFSLRESKYKVLSVRP